jgi:hypothetical protein
LSLLKGATGVAYSRGADLLAFKKIRVQEFGPTPSGCAHA